VIGHVTHEVEGCSGSTTIADLKRTLSPLAKHMPEDLRLILKGESLEDGKTFEELAIFSESVMQLAILLPEKNKEVLAVQQQILEGDCEIGFELICKAPFESSHRPIKTQVISTKSTDAALSDDQKIRLIIDAYHMAKAAGKEQNYEVLAVLRLKNSFSSELVVEHENDFGLSAYEARDGQPLVRVPLVSFSDAAGSFVPLRNPNKAEASEMMATAEASFYSTIASRVSGCQVAPSAPPARNELIVRVIHEATANYLACPAIIKGALEVFLDYLNQFLQHGQELNPEHYRSYISSTSYAVELVEVLDQLATFIITEAYRDTGLSKGPCIGEFKQCVEEEVLILSSDVALESSPAGGGGVGGPAVLDATQVVLITALQEAMSAMNAYLVKRKAEGNDAHYQRRQAHWLGVLENLRAGKVNDIRPFEGTFLSPAREYKQCLDNIKAAVAKLDESQVRSITSRFAFDCENVFLGVGVQAVPSAPPASAPFMAKLAEVTYPPSYCP
jgi:hypothetical protein